MYQVATSSEFSNNIKTKLIALLILFVGIFVATDITAFLLKMYGISMHPLVFLSPIIRRTFSLIGFLILFSSCYEFFKRKLKINPLLVIGFSFGLCFTLLSWTGLYNPFDYFFWLYYQGNNVREFLWYVGIVILIFSGILSGLYHIKHIQRKKLVSDLHGSARFATQEDIEKTGLLDIKKEFAIYVGTWKKNKSTYADYLRYTGESNVFVLGPSRSGKGAGLVIPTLLSYEGNCINTDLKLENWHYTAGARKAMGQTVLKFDFTCTDGSAACFNPLLEVRKGMYEVRDVQNIVDMIADPYGEGRPDHWTDTANDLLVSIILHVLYYEKDKSLPGVRHFISNINMTESELFEYMLNTKHDLDGCYGWTDPITGELTRTHPLVAAGAKDMLNRAEAERSGVISTFKRLLKIYRDPLIAKNMRTSDFRILDLVDPKKQVTLYLYMPPSDKARTRPLIRLILNLILTRLTESWNSHDTQAAKRRPMLLLMDEFPQLGRLEFFESALAYTAGYGIKTCLICQDLSMVYKEYGHYQSIMSNCEITLAYAPNKLETAQHLSDMLGHQTIVKETKNYSGQRLSNYLHQMSTSEHEYKRALMTPDELMRMPFESSIIFKTGFHPIKAHKGFYFHDDVFKKRANIPAPIASDKLMVVHDWSYFNTKTEEMNTNHSEIEESDDLLLRETDDLL